MTTDTIQLRRPVSFNIRHDLAEAIREFATENRKKINAVIEEAFSEYLARRNVERQG